MNIWFLKCALCKIALRLWIKKRKSSRKIVTVWKRSCHKPEGGGGNIFACKDQKWWEVPWMSVIIKVKAITLRCPIVQNVPFCMLWRFYFKHIYSRLTANTQPWSWWMQQHLLCHGSAVRSVMKSRMLRLGTGQLSCCDYQVVSAWAERTTERQLVSRVLTKCFQQTKSMCSYFTETWLLLKRAAGLHCPV